MGMSFFKMLDEKEVFSEITKYKEKSNVEKSVDNVEKSNNDIDTDGEEN